MKRLLPAVPALLLCLTLAACAAPTPTPTSTPTPTPTPIPALEPPLSDSTKAQPVPDFLDTDQQALFLHAFEAANFLMGCETSYVDRFPFDDGSMPDLDHFQTVELGGDLYVISVGRYARWADFKAMMDALFTSEYQEELLYFTRAHGTPQPLFTSTEDGRLCYLDASRGSSLEYGWSGTPDSYQLVRRTEDEIVFDLIGHYAVLAEAPEGAEEPLIITGETTEAYPIRMERTEDGWRVAEIHLPY